MDSNKKLYWLGGFMLWLTVFIFTVPIWIVHVDWIKRDYGQTTKDVTGVIGDTVGGFWGPGMGLVGAILTFFAFYVQYQANQLQKKDIADQRRDWQIERFESRFFELLKLHKENVTDMSLVDGVKGRECFKELFQELMSIKTLIDRENQGNNPASDEIDYTNLCYFIFYYGIGPDLELLYTSKLSGQEWDMFRRLKPPTGWQKAVFEAKNTEELVYQFKYPPYRGHSPLLGAYYRHLYQTVKYVTEFKHFKEPEEKYQFIQILRDQISDYEQLMLYFNGTSLFPEKWNRLFTEFRLIKNIPVELAKGLSSPLVRYQEAMIVLWLTEHKRLFAAQNNDDMRIGEWIAANPEAFKKLKLHESHTEYLHRQIRMNNEG